MTDFLQFVDPPANLSATWQNDVRDHLQRYARLSVPQDMPRPPRDQEALCRSWSEHQVRQSAALADCRTRLGALLGASVAFARLGDLPSQRLCLGYAVHEYGLEDAPADLIAAREMARSWTPRQ